MSNTNSTKIMKQLEEVFQSHDEKNKGYLKPKELKKLVNEFRNSLNLTKCDDELFNRIQLIIDKNQDCKIDCQEFINGYKEILPIIVEPSNNMQNAIKQAFQDFDLNNNGYIQKNEFKLLQNLACDKLGVYRCQNWQADYLFNLFDDDDNQKIDIEEFMDNYRVINQELLKNKSWTKRKQRGVDFFQDGLCFGNNAEKNYDRLQTMPLTAIPDPLIADMDSYQKDSRKQKTLNRLERCGSNLDPKMKIDLVNVYSKENSKLFIPLDSLVNNKDLYGDKDNYDETLANNTNKLYDSRDQTPDIVIADFEESVNKR